MRMAKIFKTQSKQNKLACIANYCQSTTKQGLIFCFSKEECEKMIGFLKGSGIKVAGYYRSSKGYDSRKQKNNYDAIDTAFLEGNITALVVPIAYKVDLSRVSHRIYFLLYSDRPAFMSDYQYYYDLIYMNNREFGDCSIYLVNDQIKEDYDDYFLEKAATYEMVQKIYEIYKSSNKALSEIDISNKLGCGVGKVRYSHHYLINSGVIVNDITNSTKYVLALRKTSFDKEEIESELRKLEEEYLKMIKYCWQT